MRFVSLQHFQHKSVFEFVSLYKIEKNRIFILTFAHPCDILNKSHENKLHKMRMTCGGIAQLARVLGSYPIGRWFESCCRYHMARWSRG